MNKTMTHKGICNLIIKQLRNINLILGTKQINISFRNKTFHQFTFPLVSPAHI